MAGVRRVVVLAILLAGCADQPSAIDYSHLLVVRKSVPDTSIPSTQPTTQHGIIYEDDHNILAVTGALTRPAEQNP